MWWSKQKPSSRAVGCSPVSHLQAHSPTSLAFSSLISLFVGDTRNGHAERVRLGYRNRELLRLVEVDITSGGSVCVSSAQLHESRVDDRVAAHRVPQEQWQHEPASHRRRL